MGLRRHQLVGGTLTRRLLALYLVIGLVGAGVALPLFFFQVKAHLERNLVRLQEQTAWRAAMTARGYIGELYEHIEVMSFSQSMVDMELQGQRADLARLLENEPLIAEVSVLNPLGQEVVRVSLDPAMADKLRNLSADPCVRQAASRKQCFGRPFYALQAGYMMAASVPILRQGTVVGVIRGVISIQPLSQELGELEVGRTGAVYLVDGEGHLLAHRDLAALGSEFNVSSRPVVARLMEGKKVSALEPGSFYSSAQGERMVSTGLPLEEFGWGVVATTSLEEFSEPVRGLMLMLVPAMSVISVLGLLAIAFMTQRWLRPLGQLHLATQTLAAGDLGHRVGITSGDELQSLGEDFNSMAERLQGSLGQFRTLVETMPGALAVYDLERRITIVNLSFARMTGYTEAELLGRDVFSMVPTEEQQHVQSMVARRLAGESSTYETAVLRKDGQEVPALARSVPFRDSQGHIIGGLSVLTDLTEVKKLQSEKAQAEKMAALGHLTSIVAHELRNPMGAINNSLYYLRLRIGESDEKLSWHMRTISRSVVSMSRIVEDLLDYTRPKAPSFEPVSLNQIVGEALSRSSIPEDVTVVQDLAAALPSLQADPEMLRRVFLNLVINALQAMPQGGTLTVSTSANAKWQGAIVEDTGEGMPRELLEKLFQPLFTTRAKGTGLGLYICRQIVTQHGGDIQVASQPGQGTTVTVRLPTLKEEVDV